MAGFVVAARDTNLVAVLIPGSGRFFGVDDARVGLFPGLRLVSFIHVYCRK